MGSDMYGERREAAPRERDALAKMLKLVNKDLATAEAALLVAARDKLCRGHRFDGGAYRDEYELVTAYKQRAKEDAG